MTADELGMLILSKNDWSLNRFEPIHIKIMLETGEEFIRTVWAFIYQKNIKLLTHESIIHITQELIYQGANI